MKYLTLVFLLLFTGCSINNYQHTQSKIIIIKSPLIKFADLGYIRNTNDSIGLELFIAGQRIQNIEINHLICVDDGCMTKSGFNTDYLNSHYPDDILQNILLSRPIFDSKNKVKIDDGFEQRIVNENVEIIYRITSKVIYFKDKKNRIIIKIKSVE